MVLSGGSPATSTERDPGNVLYTEPGCHDVGLTVHNAAGSDAVTITCQVIVDVNTTVGASMEERIHIQVMDGSIVVRHGHGAPFTAELFDLQGRTLRQAQGTGYLLLNDLRPGPVLLRIKTSEGVLVRKVLVQ